MLPIALNIPLAQGEVGGIGKYLTIEISGEGSVNALKEKSGETWDFPPNETVKVGAGTVLLTATPAQGWDFFEWLGDVEDNSISPTYYKTEKEGIVTAVFVKKLFKITVTTPVGGGNIHLDGVPVSGDIFVEYGATPEFTFVPDEGNYISSVAVNGSTLDSFVSSYMFPPVTADQTLDVYFSQEGTAFVPAGSDVNVFFNPLNPSESMMFIDAGDGGTATVDDLEEMIDYPVGALAAGWIINVDFTGYGDVLITFQYDPGNLTENEQSELRLIRAETLEALRSDVNKDLVVDGQDVCLVANAVKHPEWYDPLCDVDNDGEVTEDDVHMVNENKGAILVDITYGPVDTVNNIIHGITDRFSIFGAHCR
jgi:hypothetical protein